MTKHVSSAVTVYTNAHMIEALTDRVKELEAEIEDTRQQIKLIQSELMGIKVDTYYDEE